VDLAGVEPASAVSL